LKKKKGRKRKKIFKNRIVSKKKPAKKISFLSRPVHHIFISAATGSHVVLRRENTGCVIPRHKTLAIGTLKNAIKQAGITDQEFLDNYKKR
jgi:hypothetical protein